MGMVSAWDEQLLENTFKKDQSGRLVFLPFGPRPEGYYIDSANDEEKTKPFAKMYFLSKGLLQFVGNTSAYFLAQGVMFSDPLTSVAHKVKVFLVIYSISIFIFGLLPMWLLGKLYRKSILEICSGMTVAGSEAISKLERNVNPLRRRALFVALGAVILLAGIVLLLISRR
jgi:hypothetical protein